MSGNNNRISGKSVAAFLFLPQFHLSFRNFSFIVPVFIRTLAIMLEQAGLIQHNHPATRYGMEGVKKYTTAQLIGEAWHTLQTNSYNTPYQWGLFAGIFLMIAFAICSVITGILHMVVSTASAQIFDHPAGHDTTQIATAPAGVLYDMSAGSTAASADYAIRILDKVLRQAGELTGAPLQNALAAVMQIYNTGILVVASVLIFWAIISIVVDTAKTGHFGGGRHNMVWAPIRIVFALGLLIPLGSNGFSSGQYMVMKLAEWGSNFGSQAWAAYVGSVASGTLIGNDGRENASQLISQYTRIITCEVAYNAYQYQSAGVTAANADQWVFGRFAPSAPDAPHITVKYTNRTAPALCGTIKYANPAEADLVEALTLNPGDPVAQYKQASRTAHMNALMAREPTARNFACDFVGEFITDGSLGASGICAGIGLCGGGAEGDGDWPDEAGGGCLKQMVENYFSDIDAALTTARNNLVTYVSSGPFVTKITERGWAGMGIWYHEISRMNTTVAAGSQPTISITDPEINSDSGHDCGYRGNRVFSCKTSDHVTMVQDVLAKYSEWWKTSPSIDGSGGPSAFGPAGDLEAPDWSIKSLIDAFTDSFNSAANFMVDLIFGSQGQYFLVDLQGFGTANPTYPMAQLSMVGEEIIGKSLYAFGLMAAISLAGNALPFVDVNMGETALFSMLGTLAMAGFAAGIVLMYYIPLLPWVRVTFAVLTWIISVFEAVIMVPIAALAHLTTEGDGLAGGARQAYILWLNVLLRPILTVIGFIGAILIFNAMVLFVNDTMLMSLGSIAAGEAPSVFARIFYTIMYVGIVYTIANSTFKMMDIIPNALMRWMGGSPDQSFDDSSTEGYIAAAGSGIARAGPGFGSMAATTGRGAAGAGRMGWNAMKRGGGGASQS